MTAQRPGRLLAIAIVALVLGGLGIMAGLWSIAGALMQGPMMEAQQRMLDQGGTGSETARAQKEMQEGIQELTREWMPHTLTQQGLNLLASGLLVVVGILLLRWAPIAPRLFGVAAAANALVDLAGAVVGTLFQIRMMERMVEVGPGMDAGNAEFGRIFSAMMKATGWVTACFALVWLLLKVGYYVWGLSYLRRPDVRRLFAGGDAMPPPDPGSPSGPLP